MEIRRSVSIIACVIIAIFLSSCKCKNQGDVFNSRYNNSDVSSGADISMVISQESSGESKCTQSASLNKNNESGGLESDSFSDDKCSSENDIENNKYQDVVEKSVEILASIDRKNINALVNVYLVDFTFDGIPEMVVSYDTGSGHSYVENDVYELQSEKRESIFSFHTSGITRGYMQSIFLYEDLNCEKFFAFIYGLDSGNYLKRDCIDKLELINNKYSVSNMFSTTIVTDPNQSSYSNEFICNGKVTDAISFEQERSYWLSNLRECQFCRVQVPIEAADWGEEEILKNRLTNAFADYDSRTN